MKGKLGLRALRLSAFFMILLAVGLFSISLGSVYIPLKNILKAIWTGRKSTDYTIVVDLRLSRTLLAFSVGGALSLSGVILQGLFRNPLVEPYTLGISGGAALLVSLNIALHLYAKLGISSLPISGFLGSLAVITLIYYLNLRGNALKMQGLLLAGVMISFISSSLIMLIMAVSRSEDLHGIVLWIMGSLGNTSWTWVIITGVSSVLGLLASYMFALDLNALSLGEEEALHLGVDVERCKKFLFLLASLLTGLCVSSAGIIGFVGLVVPHFVRMFLGEDHRVLLLGSFILGACFLALCDTLARTIIRPMELPVGVITGIVGGSLFIYALTKKEIILGDGR